MDYPLAHARMEVVPGGLPAVRVNLDNLRHNWRLLAAKAKGGQPMPVLKADAYGHGIVPVARALVEQGCRSFCVGSVADGVALRRALAGPVASGVRILPLLGLMHAEDAQVAVTHGILPLVCSAQQAAWVSGANSRYKSLPVAVKVETGMSRLGFRPGDIADMLAAFDAHPNLKPTLLVSHLAAADDPTQDISVGRQLERFLSAYVALRDYWPNIELSIANSAGFLAQDTILADVPTHTARPGYALYGGNPFAGTEREYLGEGLRPVMAISAPILGVYSLAKGEGVGYGLTYTAPEEKRVAIVGAGYADGYSRNLSNKGHASIRGCLCPVLGRVCMQMFIADVTHVPDVAVGDDAYLLGGDEPGCVSMEALARDWGSIPYEIFCIMGKNRHFYHTTESQVQPL